MRSLPSQANDNYVRMGAVGAVGAITMLWVGGLNAGFFQAGTVLLVLSLVPLARGMGTRGGAIIGLLLGLVWVAARLGLARTLNADVLLTELNVMAVAAMITIGGLAGAMFASLQQGEGERGEGRGARGERQEPRDEGRDGPNASLAPHSSSLTPGLPPRIMMLEDVWGEALARHREWMAGWDQANSPWTSFDSHIRELTRMLAGLRQLRCYRVGSEGHLYPLSQEGHRDVLKPPSSGLLAHVVTTGQPFLQGGTTTGPMIQELARASETPVVWALPIRDAGATVGLMTASGTSDPPAGEERICRAADLVQELWLHVHHLDLLRVARQTDRGSGLINRTDFLPTLKATLERSYKLREPVVLMVVCIEGLRALDDASQWSQRDVLVETVGQAIASGLRKDDVVGRFSDAQFVALLRRLDTPLAELICRKLMSSIAKVICDFELTTWVTPRAGLSGSGFEQAPAEDLLRHALNALTKARSQDVLLVSGTAAGGKPMEAAR